MKPGAGRAARYMTGKMPINAKNSSRKEQPTSKSVAKPTSSTSVAQTNTNMTEDEQMAAMFKAQKEAWSAEQADMAT
jgi:protein MPE1